MTRGGAGGGDRDDTLLAEVGNRNDTWLAAMRPPTSSTPATALRASRRVSNLRSKVSPTPSAAYDVASAIITKPTLIPLVVIAVALGCTNAAATVSGVGTATASRGRLSDSAIVHPAAVTSDRSRTRMSRQPGAKSMGGCSTCDDVAASRTSDGRLDVPEPDADVISSAPTTNAAGSTR